MKRIALAIILISYGFTAGAQIIEEIEFINQPIRDVLLVLAELGNKSIIADETVSGNTSHYFRDINVDEALETILGPNNLYSVERNGILYISRIRVLYNEATDLVSIDAEQVSVSQIVRKLSRELGKTILTDSMPNDNISIHIKDITPERALTILIRRFTNLSLESEEDHFYIKNETVSSSSSSAASRGRGSQFTEENGLYSIDARNIRVSELLDGLFTEEEAEYALLKRGDSLLERFSFENKSFSEMLRLIMELTDSDYTLDNGIYYIYEISRNDVLKRFDTIVRIPLDYVPVATLPGIFPTGIISSSNFKIDRPSNSIILNGSTSEIGPLIDFLKDIDQPMEGKEYYRFDLAYSTVEDMVAIIPEQYKSSDAIPVRNTRSFLMLLSANQYEQLKEFIDLADQREQGIPVELRFIKSEDLIANLPPSVTTDSVIATVDPRRIFFKGSPEAFELFKNELEYIDRPVPQIRYEVIVIQHSEASALTYGGLTASYNGSSGVAGDMDFVGEIGNLFNLSFDIVDQMGNIFALALNADIENKKAQILADTTLNGLSGQELSFQNSSTTRYQEKERDPDTGKLTESGVTREITSGLFVTISGWVSGDGMITMDVQTTISKQTAGTGDNPPGTSERVINTNVRTQSGEPIIIGGLMQQDSDFQQTGVPGLIDVAVIGDALSAQDNTVTNSELVVYIVPHIEYAYYENNSISDIFEALYDKHGITVDPGL